MSPSYSQATSMGSPADIRNYLLDSGASSHFTPFKSDLYNVTPASAQIMLADSSVIRASHQGEVTIRFTSEQDYPCELILRRVLYVPGLNR